MVERLVIAERFEVERLVGTGGMGEVYQAVDRLSGGPVAIKLLHPGLTRDAERFKREAQLLAELSHPRVVRYVAHGTTTLGRPYIAMEWLDGNDLGDRLSQGGLTLDEAVSVVRRAAEALGALHERGIVHRDVKPSNLFLVGGDLQQVKLLDLGIARLTTPTRPATRSGIMVGTPGYMAPEQARGAKEIDARADVFSLGCVLFECVTGVPAFVGDNVAALLAKILLEESPRILEHRKDAPLPLDDLCSRMLSKHPGARPADGMAVARELAQIARGGLDGTKRSDVREIRAITGGERRLVSVVMGASILGAVQHDAETLSENTAVASLDMRSVVAPFGAQFESLADGSVVVAVTGKGSATDQAAHAARCALSIRAHMPEAHMVLATGLATVTDRSLFGDVLDRAAAMLLEAKRAHALPGPDGTLKAPQLPLPIRLDETTAGLLDVRFDVDGDESGLLLRGVRSEATSMRTLLGKATPFVGRDRELQSLTALLEESIREPVARAVLVSAPPGAGKSRLVREFLTQAKSAHSNLEVWVAMGDPMSEGSPFHMLAQGIRRAAGSVEGEPLGVRRQKLRARLGRHLTGEDLTRVTEFIGELVGTPFLDETSVQLRAARQDAMLMGDQMRRAWEDWIAAECIAQPVVIVLEDLQWGDLPSVKFIDAALRNLQDLPLLVVAVARPEVHEAFPGLWSERGVQEIRLAPLVKSASERLVREFIGAAASAEEVAQVVERSAGNPFYLEELIRAVSDGRGGQLPETVLAMVEARLERLDPDARRLLRAASIFGQIFWRGGVAALLGRAWRTSELDEWLQNLVSREILVVRRRSRFPTEAEYAFRHALVREAAYAMLTADDRILGHKLAGEWLEEVGEADPVALAEHFDRGAQPTHAIEWYRKAAEQALEGNDFDAAIRHAECAIAGGAAADLLGALRLIEATASDWIGDTESALNFAGEAMEKLVPGTADWFAAAGEAALAARKMGEFEKVDEVAKAVRAFDAIPATVARLVGTAKVTSALYLAGRIAEADEMRAMLEKAGTIVVEREPSVAAWVHFARGARALWSADVEEDIVSTLAAVDAFTRAGDRRNACANQVNACFTLTTIGQLDEAERVLRDAIDTSDRMGLRATSLLARQNLGTTLGRMGRIEEAVAFEREALEGYRLQGDRVWAAISRVYLGLLFRLRGNLKDGEREVKAALEDLKPVRPIHCAGLASLALIQLDLPDPAGARASSEEAMAIYRDVGGVLEGESLIRLVYAESLWATGDVEGGKKAIAEARDKLIARADAIKNKAWRKSFLERVRENIRTLARAGEWLR